VTDLYELDDREPESPDPPTLEDIEAAYIEYCAVTPHEEAAAYLDVVLDAFEGLLAEVKHWRGLATTQEYALTPLEAPTPIHDDEMHLMKNGSAVSAARVAEREKCRAWVREVHRGPWVHLPDNEPPF
jgi:hypothetical protein